MHSASKMQQFRSKLDNWETWIKWKQSHQIENQPGNLYYCRKTQIKGIFVFPASESQCSSAGLVPVTVRDVVSLSLHCSAVYAPFKCSNVTLTQVPLSSYHWYDLLYHQVNSFSEQATVNSLPNLHSYPDDKEVDFCCLVFFPMNMKISHLVGVVCDPFPCAPMVNSIIFAN